jgi:integrase/recombinase XerC
MARLKVIKSKSTALDTLVADYVDAQRGRGKWSPRTMALNMNVLERIFIPWCVESGITTPEQLAQRVMDRFSAYQLDRVERGELVRESVRTYVRTVGTFLKWAHSEGLISEKVKAHQPRAEKKLVQTLNRQEIQKLEDAAELERDKLMVRTFADSGIRLGELRALRQSDLIEQGRERYLKVNGKGARQRLVPILPSLYARLKRYARRDGELIFMTVRKSPKTGQVEPLASRSIQNTLKFLAAAAGVDGKVTPHVFRHSFATDWLRKHKDPVTLAKILGHRDLSMISTVYEHLAAGDTYAAMLDYLRADD